MATFFANADEFRKWLARHSSKSTELVVGFFKKGSGETSITWPEAVDEALCVGWIDGVRKNIDARSYQIRFTPRKQGAIWSAVNIKRVAVLSIEGRMKPAGTAAFAHRSDARSRTYSYEQAAPIALDPASESLFRGDPSAWTYFQQQAPSYRKKLIWWIVSAKQDITRQKRLAQLIEASKKGKRL